ncbi:MAG: hypothetical protein ABS92_04675 [Thiobacillus sp. SCN 63-374]|nr:MAG: hypothetical protein ABS92_04675 [Thiobacillus sp. SCN 63-374]
MPSFTAPVWPSPGRFALALILDFVLTLAATSVWGTALVEALLPITHTLLGWIDSRFDVLFLGVEHNWQDTVIRLQLGFSKAFFLGGRVVVPDPRGAVWVTTPVGSLLQPLVIAPAMAAALPGQPAIRLARFGLAAVFALGFLVIDLPVTLHAIAWDSLAYDVKLDDFSPLLAWNQFMQSGGRLGLGVLLGAGTWWWIVRRTESD